MNQQQNEERRRRQRRRKGRKKESRQDTPFIKFAKKWTSQRKIGNRKTLSWESLFNHFCLPWLVRVSLGGQAKHAKCECECECNLRSHCWNGIEVYSGVWFMVRVRVRSVGVRRNRFEVLSVEEGEEVRVEDVDRSVCVSRFDYTGYVNLAGAYRKNHR